MRNLFLLLFSVLLMSSCATIFTSSRQVITFSGQEGTKIYDTSTNIKLAEIGSGKTATASIKKKLSDKQLVAKKDGYKTTPLLLESSFNTTSLWNILFWPGFIVDLGTGQMNKWDNTYIVVEMEKE
ncbi:MAG: hypothetical protein PHG27_04915 [Massilibacteroides sp.]|nr:hypothetical protein [Massilibacteroides sp.]MDD3061329.1 hypothetical protein [Massilibacteroides sp.]MDD4114927.1 hypothetical protein [Massilibacteroides sp.]MDD4659422.1 hypothetical protein [Massilibacteroides sp.]